MIEDDIKEYGIERHTGSDKVLSPTKFMSDGFLKSRCFLFRRVPSLMRDLEYILESLSLSEDRRTWVDIQHSTLSQYSDLLKLSQGCNPLCRQTDPSHVLFEDQYWVQALSHDLSLGGISDAICKDDKAWGHLVRKVRIESTHKKTNPQPPPSSPSLTRSLPAQRLDLQNQSLTPPYGLFVPRRLQAASRPRKSLEEPPLPASVLVLPQLEIEG